MTAKAIRDEPPAEMTVAEAAAATGRRLIDVRGVMEFTAAHIAGALHWPGDPAMLDCDRDTPLTVYCAHGVRSLHARQLLLKAGFSDVVSLRGGIRAWTDAGLPLAPATPSRDDAHRALPQIGSAGQERLAAASVVVVGLGGLGCSVAMHLAAAGVGRLTLVDGDRVEVTNLARQILHTPARVGMRKTASAVAALNMLNPDVEVIARGEITDVAAAMGVIAGHDAAVSCVDSTEARRWINGAAVALGVPLVDAAASGWEGEVATMIPRRSACFECRHPTLSTGATPCAQTGVLASLPGLIGCIQATEVMKLVSGAGTVLSGRVLRIDALTMRCYEFRAARDRACSVCGDEG